MSYPIIEYTNPCFPDTPYYKCTIDGATYHNTYLEVVQAWRKEMIATAMQRVDIKVLNEKAIALFMADVKIKN